LRARIAVGRKPKIESGTVRPDHLRRFIADRSVTIVLGAGVSRSRGAPTWTELTRSLWAESGLAIPIWLQDHKTELDEIRAIVGERYGKELAKRLNFVRPHPLAEQMALELLEKEFNAKRRGLRRDKTFVERLRRTLYPATPPSRDCDTLGVIARVLRAEQAREPRRIARVVTFNADDHLETETNHGHDPRRDPVVWPVARESSNPRFTRGAHGQAPIPVYHPHGFLPRGQTPWPEAADTLVFTDAQYWASVANPLSFANRVIVNALHDSICLFIGLSMFDVNLIRWLGIRYHAVCTDKKSQRETERTRGTQSRHGEPSERGSLERHFWIRLRHEDGDGLVSSIVRERGVMSVEISDWGASFEELLDSCFPAA
jgi:hypothetical protein